MQRQHKKRLKDRYKEKSWTAKLTFFSLKSNLDTRKRSPERSSSMAASSEVSFLKL